MQRHQLCISLTRLISEGYMHIAQSTSFLILMITTRRVLSTSWNRRGMLQTLQQFHEPGSLMPFHNTDISALLHVLPFNSLSYAFCSISRTKSTTVWVQTAQESTSSQVVSINTLATKSCNRKFTSHICMSFQMKKKRKRKREFTNHMLLWHLCNINW